MRVIAGAWRGRRLHAPGEGVRPTTDRVKEAVFNIIGARVEGAVFLDLCCGSGALGIEALSRGAARALFVDASRAALAAARSNLAACGADESSFRLIGGDAGRWFADWRPADADAGAGWLAVADPPYRDDLADAIMERMEELSGERGFRMGIVEFGSRTPVDPAADAAGWEFRSYGESRLAVRRP